MRRRTRRLLVVAALGIAQAVASGQGAAPTLDHSAPFLGHVLEVEFADGVPGQPVRLLASAAADSVDLPVGTLELDRSQLTVAGTTTIAPDGTARFELPQSADPASAETELHLQALAGDPSAHAQAVLSEALHLRLLGPRVYVGCEGYSSFRAGVWVASALRDEVVVKVELDHATSVGHFGGEANVVLTPNQARGAWMASPRELVTFDPFFGAVESSTLFASASQTLLTDSSGTRLAVLETGEPNATARVHLLDFESAAPLWAIDLPERASGHWASDGAGAAWVAVFDDEGFTRVRRVDLDGGTVGPSYPVGHERSIRFTALSIAEGQVFVGSDSGSVPPFSGSGALTRLELADPISGAHVTELFDQRNPRQFTPVPEAGMFLFALGGHFNHDLGATRLEGPSAVVEIDTPQIYHVVKDMVARDEGVWVLVGDDDADGQEMLYHMPDAATGQWEFVGDTPYFGGSVQIDSLRDAFVDHIVYTSDEGAFPDLFPPLLVLVDPRSGAELELPVGREPRALRVVPVP